MDADMKGFLIIGLMILAIVLASALIPACAGWETKKDICSQEEIAYRCNKQLDSCKINNTVSDTGLCVQMYLACESMQTRICEEENA